MYIGNKPNLLATRIDKSDLLVYPYFWQTYRPSYIDTCMYQAKSRDKPVNHSCQFSCIASQLGLFPYFLNM